MPQPTPDHEMLSALGIDPSTVKKGSLSVIWDGDPNPVITYTVLARVPQALLAKAMIASLGEGKQDEDVSRETSAAALAKRRIHPPERHGDHDRIIDDPTDDLGGPGE